MIPARGYNEKEYRRNMPERIIAMLIRNRLVRILLVVLGACYLSGCILPAPVPTRTMDFEEGIRALALSLGDQAEKSTLGNMLNKVVINQVTKHKQMKKLVIDPIIDAESGYPVKVNARIAEIVSLEMMNRFEVTGMMNPENLDASELVLAGMVTIAEKNGDAGGAYKVYGTVFEKATGKILASASVRVNRFNTEPMEIYKDSPTFVKGRNYDDFAASVKKSSGGAVEKGYRDRLAAKSVLVKADALYEKKDYRKSMTIYDQAAGGDGASQLDVLNGRFATLFRQGRFDDAESVYAKLIRASIAETSEVATKITFPPNSVSPVEGKANLYNIYLKEIALLVAAGPECRIKIIGHSSKSGKESYNENLSLQRSAWIQKKMTSFAAGVAGKSETIGRGFQENIVGTGADNSTDEIDRRVEFKFDRCGAR